MKNGCKCCRYDITVIIMMMMINHCYIADKSNERKATMRGEVPRRRVLRATSQRGRNDRRGGGGGGHSVVIASITVISSPVFCILFLSP